MNREHVASGLAVGIAISLLTLAVGVPLWLSILTDNALFLIWAIVFAVVAIILIDWSWDQILEWSKR